MKNKDLVMQKKNEITQRINAAVKEGNEEAFSSAFEEMVTLIQDTVLDEARGIASTQDSAILMGRGVRTLTSKERGYYEKVMDAMRSKTPQQALTMIDEALPTTVIDAVLEDIQESHPLLAEINFQNTGILTEIIVSSLDGRFTAVWGKLCDEIVTALTSGLLAIDLEQNKLSAFIPVCKAMLEVGPEWLDRYVRAILAESIANGLENAIINGTGVDMPVGMTKDPNGLFDAGAGYPDLVPDAITQITPATYGDLIAELAVGPNLLYRNISEVLLICNPVDYYTTIMPAVMYQNAEGIWVSRFPFPTKVVQSVHVTEGTAVLGLSKRYFFGLGTGKGGRIEFSDHYHFLEDERMYLTKLYGDGKPLDSTSFKVLDISGLVPVIPSVEIATNPVPISGTVAISNDPLGVEIEGEPIEVLGMVDARLASLKIGAKTLTPTFNKSVF
ncbi:MAG: phage major capsid protein, partial [Candidatus Nanoarchaeia archaeon]|nr:phage major capsid protein [Candidatus Nanoarchaeia archaeon]